MPAENSNTCSLCGHPIAETATGGQCPACLLGFALETASPKVDARLLSPTQLRYFGDYELKEEIARGGMGIVYRAHQVSLNRPVAVKMILTGQLATPASVARFQTEAEAAARLDHPNIIPVYEVGEHETQHYFSMKLVQGGQPVSHWAAGKPLAEVIEAMEEVVRAIAYAHTRGVLHRDLKPHNVLVGSDDDPLVTDFGLAKLIGETSANLTLTTTVLGSPAYMAPEQAEGDSTITTSADIYGLGAILYELFTGHPPFEGNTTLSILTSLREQSPVKPRRWNPSLHRDLETIALKCLEKRPADRYATAAELAEDLARFQRREPVSARSLSLPETMWRWCRRNPAVAALSGIALATLISGVIFVIIEKNRTAAANVQLEESINSLEWGLVDTAINRGDHPRALAYLASTLREDPTNWQAAVFATSILSQQSFPILAGPPASAERCAAINADGTLLATAKNDGTISITTTAESASAHPPIQLTPPPSTLTFSPEGTHLAVSTDDRTHLFSLVKPGSPPNVILGDARVSASGKTLVSLQDTHFTASHWDGKTLSTTKIESLPENWKTNSDGTRAITYNGKIFRAWDLKSGKQLTTWKASERPKYFDLSTDGSTVITGGAGGRYEVFSATTGDLILKDSGRRFGLQNLALDATGSRSYRFFHDGTAQVSGATTGRPVSSFLSHRYDYTASQFSADRSHLLIAGSQRRVRLWSLEDRKMISSPIFVENENPTIALAHDGNHALIVEKNRAFVWKFSPVHPPEIFRSPGKGFLNPCLITPDGRWVVISDNQGATIINRSTGAYEFSFATKGAPYSQLYDPTTTRLTTVTDRGQLRCHQLDISKIIWEITPAKTAFRCSLITPDYKKIIAGADDGIIRFFDATDGTLFHTATFGRYVRALNIFPDGRTILAAGDGGEAATYDIATGLEKLRIRAHPHATTIVSTAISPDGQRFATASYDKTARIWDAATGKPVSPPLPHLDELSHLTFSADGTRLATAARDGNARIWDAYDGSPLSSWLPHPRSATTVKFTPDSKRLVVRHFGGFRLWDARNALPISINYRMAASTGIGIDFPMLRDIISADGNTVQLGVHSDAVSLWDISPPQTKCPPWFPDFLEAIARQRVQPDGSITIVPHEEQLNIREIIASRDDWYARWAKRIIGES